MSVLFSELAINRLGNDEEEVPLRRFPKCLWDWQVQLATKMPMGKNVYQKENKKNSLEELKLWLLFLCFLRKGYKLAAKCSQHQQKFQCCQKDLRCVKLLQMRIEVVSDLIAQGTVCPEISHRSHAQQLPECLLGHKVLLMVKNTEGHEHSSFKSNFLSVAANMDVLQ